MNRQEALAEIKKLDKAYTEKGKEAQFWGNEYRLAGSASKYVKASQKPVILERRQKALDEQDAIWKQMSAILDQFENLINEAI